MRSTFICVLSRPGCYGLIRKPERSLQWSYRATHVGPLHGKKKCVSLSLRLLSLSSSPRVEGGRCAVGLYQSASRRDKQDACIQ